MPKGPMANQCLRMGVRSAHRRRSDAEERQRWGGMGSSVISCTYLLKMRKRIAQSMWISPVEKMYGARMGLAAGHSVKKTDPSGDRCRSGVPAQCRNEFRPGAAPERPVNIIGDYAQNTSVAKIFGLAQTIRQTFIVIEL